MCRFIERFNPSFGLFPFHEPGGILQKCIRFRSTDEKHWHLECVQFTPYVKVMHSCAIDLRFPRRGISKLELSVRFARHTFGILLEVFFAHVAENVPITIPLKE